MKRRAASTLLLSFAMCCCASVVVAQTGGNGAAPPANVPPEIVAAARAAGETQATPSQQQVQPLSQPRSGSAIERTPLGQATTQTASGVQAETTPATLGGSAVRTVSALLAVLTLMLGGALLVKWMGKKGYLPSSLSGGVGSASQARAVPGLLEVLAKYPMSGGSTLLVMKFDRRVLLINQTKLKGWRGPTQMQTLCELSSAEDVASVLLRTRADEDTRRAAEFEAALRREDEAMMRENANREALPARETQRREVPQRERMQREVSATKPARAKATRTEASRSESVRADSARALNQPTNSLGGGRYA